MIIALRLVVVAAFVLPLVSSPANGADLPAGKDSKLPLTPDKVIKLPEAAEDVAVGGAGRYLVLHFAKLRKLGIFDCVEGKLTHYISLPEGKVVFAAGLEKLIVVPSTGTIERWNLASGERELAAVLPIPGTVTSACMGSASRGPLLVNISPPTGPSRLEFLDIESIKLLDVKWSETKPVFGERRHMRVSADGRVFCQGVARASSGDSHCLVLTGNRVKHYSRYRDLYFMLPGPDGKVLFTNQGLLTPEMERLAPAPQDITRYVPACVGPFYLLWQRPDPARVDRRSTPQPVAPKGGKGTVPSPENAPVTAVYLLDEARPIANLSDIEGLADIGRQRLHEPGISWDQRVVFLPHLKLIVTLPLGNDRLVLHRFDIEQALAKSAIDHLLVLSPPPGTVKKGTAFSHQLAVLSKKGGVKYRLAAAPKGVTISDKGKIAWQVPADWSEGKASVIVGISDFGGEERFHAFMLDPRN